MSEPVIQRLESDPARALASLAAVLTAAGQRASHLFESVTAGGPLSRWSILFSAADERLAAPATPSADAPRFLDAFQQAISRRQPLDDAFDADDWLAAQGLPRTFPFLGGWSFFLAYEMAAEIEPTLDLPPFALGAESGFPRAIAEYHPAALVRDHDSGEDIVVHDGSVQGAELAKALISARVRAGETAGRDQHRGEVELTELLPPVGAPHRERVARVRDYLFAGDVFQANLSHAWRFRLAPGVSSGAVYGSLCRRNPAPFAAWYRQPEGEIISSSPERLLRVAEGHAETRPIAGTRRRDPDPERDQELIEQLRAHPKERAEHVMLIDLERNDLGRVCEPGSVRVDELMVVESYAQVHHLVSNIVGRLPASTSPLAALAACFPGGTITGCPKVRCMEILAELEQTGRGPYTGSLGYLSNHGQMDSNILIRSLFLSPDRRGEFRTGGGIVADSDPARELDETYQKARGVLDALGGEAALVAGVPVG
ncbi:chorismate-binding protein [Guyparkeria halophila]|uniref:Chorismate-binding protein n=1 Tax=Guyparkeria halophila TaxID=47960 RepID=A0ABZ0YYI3_9GAMM|nr:chorismate-binding protein [Guyparkeria halophila]WQH17106.1 chorismate-binding protein [Guyparkeria halophila]